MEKLVFVGGGLASARAVERLRDEGYAGSVTVVAAEHHLPYERPPLSKDLLLGKDSDPTVLSGPWWRDHDVDLRTGVVVTDIDRDGRRLAMDSGTWLDYDLLVLATGAEPRRVEVPGAEHAHVLRTLDDAEQLIAGMEAGGRFVIVGAGWIGLEVAAAVRGHGLDVTVLESAEVPLEKALGPRVGTYIADLHRSHGVDLRLGVTVEEVLVESSRPVGVRTSDEVIEASYVLIATGSVPAVGLAERAGLEVDEGIVVDGRFQTRDDHILAIGDVARAWNVALNDRIRVEHWDNAIRQGRAVADVILGRDTVNDWQPYFFTDQFEFSMEYVGHGSADDSVEIRGDQTSHQFIAYWIDAQDRLTAAMNVGIWDVNDTLREMIGTTVVRSELTDLRAVADA